MACEFVPLPGGGKAIVCSSRRRQRCKCGNSVCPPLAEALVRANARWMIAADDAAGEKAA